MNVSSENQSKERNTSKIIMNNNTSRHNVTDVYLESICSSSPDKSFKLSSTKKQVPVKMTNTSMGMRSTMGKVTDKKDTNLNAKPKVQII